MVLTSCMDMVMVSLDWRQGRSGQAGLGAEHLVAGANRRAQELQLLHLDADVAELLQAILDRQDVLRLLHRRDGQHLLDRAVGVEDRLANAPVRNAGSS